MDRFEEVWEKWDREELAGQISSHCENRKKYLDLVKKYLGKGGEARALEAGCGSSIDAHIVAEGMDAEIYGIDISRKALDIARNVSQHFDRKVTLALGDVLNLEFEKNSFDVVFSQGLIEHFKKPLDALEEQVRVLRPGGVLIVNVPQKFTAYTVHKHILARLGRWEWGEETEFSSRELARYGDRLGLEFLERCGYDYWRSPFEIMFVLRTLDRKIGKVPFVKRAHALVVISRFWTKWWDLLEEKFGHLFMKNIIYVYRKHYEDTFR